MNMVKRFSTPVCCALHDKKLWVTFKNHSFTFHSLSEIEREKNSGILPDSFTDNDIYRIKKHCFRALKKGESDSQLSHKVVSILGTLSLLLAVFYLGSAHMYNLSLPAQAPSNCQAGINAFIEAQRITPMQSSNIIKNEATDKKEAAACEFCWTK